MDRDRWSRLSSLFAAALEGDPQERAALFQGLEDDLRRELESLLAAHEADGPVDRLGARMDDLRGEAMASVDPLSASDPPAAARARVGAPAAQAVREELDRSLAAMRRVLGGEAARSAWQEGTGLSVEEAVGLAGQADPPPGSTEEEKRFQ